MTQTNPNHPWGSAEAVLQLANDIDPETRSGPPSDTRLYVAAEELRALYRATEQGVGGLHYLRYAKAVLACYAAQPQPSGNATIEHALSELVEKIVPGLDTGDLLADAATASKALDRDQHVGDIDVVDIGQTIESKSEPSGNAGELADVLADALSNLEHDNYERSYSGSKNREADAAMIRAAIAAQAKPSINTGELESVADKLFAEAYQAGMDGDEFDVLRAKRLIARAALAARASANICNADKRQIPASQLQARGLDKDNIDAARAAEKEH